MWKDKARDKTQIIVHFFMKFHTFLFQKNHTIQSIVITSCSATNCFPLMASLIYQFFFYSRNTTESKRRKANKDRKKDRLREDENPENCVVKRNIAETMVHCCTEVEYSYFSKMSKISGSLLSNTVRFLNFCLICTLLITYFVKKGDGF